MAKIYTSEKHGYVLEIWGASTKHPDSMFFFDEFEKVEYFEDKWQVFQWLLECASKMTWPISAYCLAEQAMRDWYPMRDGWQEPVLKEWSQDHWHPSYR